MLNNIIINNKQYIYRFLYMLKNLYLRKNEFVLNDSEVLIE